MTFSKLVISSLTNGVQMEFDHLCGYHDKQNCIYGFAFVDDYERLVLARMITTSFMAHGVSHGRSHDLAYRKTVLRPRAQ